MAAIDYSAIEAAALAQLRADGPIAAEGDAGTPVHITDSPDEPTMEQCPAIQLQLANTSRTITRLGPPGSSPYNETLTMLVRCTGFSAESPADARRQRDKVTTLAIRALEGSDNTTRTLQNTVSALTIPRVDFEALRPGYFAAATVTVSLLLAS